MQNIKVLIMVLLISVINVVLGQQVINSAGGSAVIGSTQYEYNVGETIIETGTSATLIITQGLLQPSQLTTSIKDNLLTINDFLVFPNPSEFEINLKNNFSKATIIYSLVDEKGAEVLSHQPIIIDKGSVEKINVQQLAAGNYFLKLDVNIGQDKYVGTYKVLKIK
ncbi:MAG: T9SS type A sorting domain-containing protein [Chitinophagales bacterium]|nr:T9SS type A sorting domain-containing protein [Chitinophagales bacterium]